MTPDEEKRVLQLLDDRRLECKVIEEFLDSRKAPAVPIPAPVQASAQTSTTNVMLHVHNVRRCGGTGNFAYDMARCFPEFRHVALCVNDPVGDDEWIQAVGHAMRSFYAPRLTPELIEELDPRVVVLHATGGKSLGSGDSKADWPYSWLSDGGRRYVISYHHVSTYPLVAADLDVFVSNHVAKSYEPLIPRMRASIVSPPCTDLAPFAATPARQWSSQATSWSFTAGGKGSPRLDKLIASGKLPGCTWGEKPNGKLGSMPAHFAKYQFSLVWSGLQETWCRTVTEAMASGCVVVAHRAGAIPEQITHGKNGYLFTDEAELLSVIDFLKSASKDVLERVSLEGRSWALANVGFQRLRADLYPYIMRGLLNAA